jgi:predicted nucleic acid-binding protein
MNPVVYDAGVLIAADRDARSTWADHRVRLEDGVVPVVPSAIVAQVSRSPRQVQLRRFLRGCDVAILDEDGAHDAGLLLGRTRTSDICDAIVVALAANLGAEVITGDRKDLRRLVTASGKRIRLHDV